MKPQETNKKLIKKSKFKYSWYKSMVKMLRNKGWKDYRNDQTIHLT